MNTWCALWTRPFTGKSKIPTNPHIVSLQVFHQPVPAVWQGPLCRLPKNNNNNHTLLRWAKAKHYLITDDRFLGKTNYSSQIKNCQENTEPHHVFLELGKPLGDRGLLSMWPSAPLDYCIMQPWCCTLKRHCLSLLSTTCQHTFLSALSSPTKQALHQPST